MAVTAKKRSLILAGGGLKVGFQAGVLQVWLDEAGLQFDHADGASGGNFNLSMYCQGMSGERIADNWRNLDPFLPVDPNWEQFGKLLWAPSAFTYDRFRKNVLPFWEIDWKKINASQRTSTFNLYNFSKKRLETKTQAEMTEDLLIASVSLPMWFPPVRIDGQTYIDSVYISDANVEEAIARGADEIWAIWTVSTRDEWLDGFVANYFQIIETTADTHFFNIWRRLEKNNAAIARGETGEFGRHIELKLLQAEVPVHYLINFSKDRMAESVNLGVATAREWCKAQGIPLRPGKELPARAASARSSLRFTEEMKGSLAMGATDPEVGYERGRQQADRSMFHLTISVDDVDRFVTDPAHEAAVKGWVGIPALGGKFSVEKGTFNLFVHEADPNVKEMRYRLFFLDSAGEPYTLSGVKLIDDDPGPDVWADTTTLFTRILEGHINADQEATATCCSAGMLKILAFDFMKQLTTFRVEGPTLHDRTSAMTRFGRLFLGKLWDTYGRKAIEYGPF